MKTSTCRDGTPKLGAYHGNDTTLSHHSYILCCFAKYALFVHRRVVEGSGLCGAMCVVLDV